MRRAYAIDDAMGASSRSLQVWRQRWHGLLVMLAMLTGAATLMALVFAGSASAGLQYPLIEQCPNVSSGIGSTAIDGHTGHILVVNGETVRVLSSSCQLLETWTGANTPAGSFSTGNGFLQVAAYDSAPNGRIYVADVGHQVIDVFNSAGEYQCQITGQEGKTSTSATECNKTTPATPSGMRVLSALAVNQENGQLYAADQGSKNGEEALVNRYSATGGFEGQINGAGTPHGSLDEVIKAMTVNTKNGQLLVEVRGGGLKAIYVFDSASDAYVSELSGAETPAGAFDGNFMPVAADDGLGVLFVADSTHRVVDELSEAGVYVDQLTGIPGENLFRELSALAVGQADHRLYVKDGADVDVFGEQRVLVPGVETVAPEELHAFSARLSGSVNPEGAVLRRCRFEYIADKEFQEHPENGFEGAVKVPCEESLASIGAGSSPVVVHANISGLQPDTSYDVRLNAANANETENEFSYGAYSPNTPLRTLAIPVIDAAETTAVLPASAEVKVAVNPKGALSSCRIEYRAGSEPAYGAHSVLCDPADLGEGQGDVNATATLTGLTAGETYYWRAVIENAATTPQPVYSSDQTLVYLQGQEVTQQCANQTLREENNSRALPDCRAYELVTPNAKNGAVLGHGIVIAPPITAANGQRVMSASIQGFDDTPSDPGARQNEGALFGFTRTTEGWATTPLSPPATQLATSTYWDAEPETGAALFSAPTPPANQDDFYLHTPTGELLNIGPMTPPQDGAIGAVMARSPFSTRDFSHIVYQLDAVSKAPWPFDATRAGSVAVYEYVGVGNSEPFLVGVTGGEGSTDLIGVCGGEPDAISADGSVVINTVDACSSGSGGNSGVKVPANAVYARVDGESSQAHTIKLSARSSEDCTGSCAHSEAANAVFAGASEDADKVYFTSSQQLTDTATQGSSNLYLYDLDGSEAEQPTAVSAGDTSGGGPQVQGVVAVSPDGSHVYFVAKGVLAENPGAANQLSTGQPQKATAGKNNLYLYQRDSQHPAGQTTFVATLPEADRLEWTGGGKANITPEGRYLLFTSHASLTSDDTRLEGPAQIYRYDAQENQLVRVSIGERGYNDNGNDSQGDAVIAEPHAGSFPNPSISNDGSYSFFESPIALAPGALNDVQIATNQVAKTPVYAQNIYEYHNGQVYLITDGTDTNSLSAGSMVKLLGASTDGQNVFFMTASPLIPADTNTQQDIYDARINGGFPAPPQPAALCISDQCHGPATTPPEQLLPPISTLFTGAENTPPPATTKTKPTTKPKTPTCTKHTTPQHKKCGKTKSKHKRRRKSSATRHSQRRRTQTHAYGKRTNRQEARK